MEQKEGFSYWSKAPKEIIKHLNSSDSGLSEKEALERLNSYGKNEIKTKQKRNGLNIFLSQFKNAFILVLIAATILAYFLGEKINSIIILSMVAMSVVLSFFQEYKAEKALLKLEKYLVFKSKVVRDGVIRQIDSRDIVPGDIVYLDIGDVVPADIRLIESKELSANESVLTGESVPVTKTISLVSSKSPIPQNLTNTVFAGTSISSGRGFGIVVSTGKDTFFGKTASYLKKEIEPEFQKSIRKFSNMLLKVILIMTIFVFSANAILGREIFDSLLFALALAVGVIPEILPIIITITLSNSSLKMAKEQVVVKKLVSIEDLGNIDTLCCDKTGTLTEGHISLIDFINLDKQRDDKVILYSMLCNSEKVKKGDSFGSEIDKAILKNQRARELLLQLADLPILQENEFDFVRKRMSVLIKSKSGNFLIAKGAPNSILSVCNSATIKGKETKITDSLLKKIKLFIEDYESKGYTVIALAEKPVTKKKVDTKDEKNLNLVGFLLFIDPPKKNSKEALNLFQKLGVNIKIMSGDSPILTKRVCEEVGLKILGGKVITGEDLEKLDDKQIEEYAMKFNVFARVTPEQKYKLVSSLNKEGHIVGFLGDGINDAPALEAADVGITVDSAVGIAKDAADIILLQKNLDVLADGIIMGRKTFGNVTKYIMNTISANYGNMFTVMISSLFLPFLPLLPSQIIFNNFLSDVPQLAVSTDNVDEEFLKKPKKWDIKLIQKFMVYFGFISVIFDLALILPLFFIMKVDTAIFRTAWFVESCASEIIVTFAIRTRRPMLNSRPSKYLIFFSILSVLVAVGITYTLFGSAFFSFAKMPLKVLILIGGVLLSYLITVEIAKRHFFEKIKE